MGVRFACHECDKPLNIKQELAGRRGVCPACGTRFRIPKSDSEKSLPIEIHQPRIAKQKATASHATATHSPVHTVSPVASPILADATVSTWYVRPPSGGQYGPATTEVLRQWIAEGRVASTALLWRDGWAQWRESQEVLPELAEKLPVSIGNGSNSLGGRNSNTENVNKTHQNAKSAPVAELSSMTGNAEIGKVKRERSLKRSLMIGLLSLLSVTLVVALILVVRNSG